MGHQFIPDKMLKMMKPEDRKALGAAGKTMEEAMAEHIAKSERELQDLCVTLLQREGIEVCRPRMDRKSTIARGWPDLTFAVQGVPVVWEVKFGDGKLSDVQVAARAKLSDEKNGWQYCEIRSFDDACNHLAHVKALAAIRRGSGPMTPREKARDIMHNPKNPDYIKYQEGDEATINKVTELLREANAS